MSKEIPALMQRSRKYFCAKKLLHTVSVQWTSTQCKHALTQDEAGCHSTRRRPPGTWQCHAFHCRCASKQTFEPDQQVRPPTQEEKINQLCDTVNDLANCVQDLTEYMPRSFARIERQLQHLDTSGRGAGRPRHSTVTGGQYDFNDIQQASLDNIRRKGDPRSSSVFIN